MEAERKILFYKDYFISFYRSLDSGAQKKIDYILGMLKIQERVSEKFVKFIREGLYEIRASYNGCIYRAFFIFDDGNIVMLFNGFQKKTQKTPDSEINKALEIKKEYYAGKK
ncbi:type II toxin-antitoxin system RelE/ParE family toxin [Caecibacteroides pullorum]|uniref:Type II toxin-antitoxin system RelE/ParE family toxin n=1 Tax=Caecibacteroides pullorum TaxID=2725562 RepID=A0AA40ZRY7_9BACT|nr:type II toxin-antitoxin system RelE/ParE family toxin [Caecibacteroides pullorum]MBM6856527.1 type II toxin-antitoxin system RelE/ParE family toxin [Caecibacteroides pullorum]MBV8057533.1 type II toxin-antitoxin system RelE/ParE family toxin [Caecibacteroides pullorum]